MLSYAVHCTKGFYIFSTELDCCRNSSVWCYIVFPSQSLSFGGSPRKQLILNQLWNENLTGFSLVLRVRSRCFWWKLLTWSTLCQLRRRIPVVNNLVIKQTCLLSQACVQLSQHWIFCLWTILWFQRGGSRPFPQLARSALTWNVVGNAPLHLMQNYDPDILHFFLPFQRCNWSATGAPIDLPLQMLGGIRYYGHRFWCWKYE